MTSPWAGFKHLHGFTQLNDGATARCFTPWGFSLEFGPTLVSLLTECCSTWVDWEAGAPQLRCFKCHRDLPLSASLSEDSMGWSEFRPWFEEVLVERVGPLEAVVAVSEVEAELQRARAHLFSG